MIDDRDRCEWVNVSSGIAHLECPRQSPARRKMVVCVCVCVCSCVRACVCVHVRACVHVFLNIGCHHYKIVVVLLFYFCCGLFLCDLLLVFSRDCLI